MSLGKKDFYAKEITDAIKKACDALKVPQEELDIEVVDTGSMGIFGLNRRKAHIRANVKGAGFIDNADIAKETAKQDVAAVPPSDELQEEKEAVTPSSGKTKKPTSPKAKQKTKNKKEPAKEKAKVPDASQATKKNSKISSESVEIIRLQLENLLKLMGFPGEVTITVVDGTIRCQVEGEYEEALTAQDGKIIDSLQYILRKLAARKVDEKLRLSIDIGQFREKRKVELVARARELAELVKADGKTQAIPPLNPSERRAVHVALQEDKDIRSRSVGDGLFKKILIYKPGKAKKPGSNKRGGRGRRGKQ